jgi:hypothetical protein
MNQGSFNFLRNIHGFNHQSATGHSPNTNTNVAIYFDKNMHYYVCSYGGCGSTVLTEYLSHFGNVYHIHDRHPPANLKYVGKNNTNENVYSEWFNNVDIPNAELKNYKIIYIYRHPLPVIYSRFAKPTGPNIPHLKNIMCDNNGNLTLYDIIHSKKDLYKLEEFFDNYSSKKERNYQIYCVKYEQFWNNVSLFNQVIGIPDIKALYPRKYEKPKPIHFEKQLRSIYNNLIIKMHNMKFIEIV